MVSLEVSKMSIMLMFLAVLCELLVLGYASDGRKTFIVRVDGDSKPTAFTTHEHWYRSSLAAVKGLKVQLSVDGEDDGLLHVYQTVLHGFSARLTEEEASEMEKTSGVLAVFPDRARQLQTTRSPQFVGLDRPNGGGLWAESNYGSDLVIGVLDTGIWPERRSFSDQDMGPVPKHWKGECQSGITFPKSFCNRKLVGARFFYRGYEATSGVMNETVESRSARDSDGHGTHTASTAAGRYVYNASMLGYAGGIAKGMAPKARIAVYKVCWASGCFDSDILSALDKAVDDGVDVISLSVGGSVVPYYLDSIAIGTFGAVQRGVFVSASAGNNGPGDGTVTNVAPWITTVGAGTMDRDFPADIVLGDGNVMRGVSMYSGKGLTPGRLFPLVYAGDAGRDESMDAYSSSLCMEGTLDPNVVKGKVVLCERGNNPRVAKGSVVKQAGGVGMILYNTASDGEGLIADPHLLPAAAVGSVAGDLIRRYILSKENPTAAITFYGTKLGVQPAPVVASFSARGPNPETFEILKPDIIAPGVNILAAWTDAVGPSGLLFDRRRTEFNIISGTSMACPHVSGVAALLKGAHPDWSPAAIKSALMTTAYVHDNRLQPMVDEATGNASTALDFGSGHVDPQKAMDPGLVYDLGVDDYVELLCSLNYTEKAIRAITRRTVGCPTRGKQPGNLNYPSFATVFDQTRAASNLSTFFTRTVTNVGPQMSIYRATVIAPRGVSVKVKPRKLKFTKKNEKLSYMLSVSAKPLELLPGNSETVFGQLLWSDGKHVVQSPIVVTRQKPY